ncbi:hypothetical protein AXY46_03405 [Achromobacter xylosoxidans]|nr:hypothetical protein AXY46_03405 [Achromobacter xylosoxidans]
MQKVFRYVLFTTNETVVHEVAASFAQNGVVFGRGDWSNISSFQSTRGLDEIVAGLEKLRGDFGLVEVNQANYRSTNPLADVLHAVS